MFFAFAINTGILVAAKISVQNAADAAAYAGAATQARQLNAISYLNYDMRRQFKKFLYRYVVAGNQGNPSFPQPSTVGGGVPGYYDFWKKDFTGACNGNTWCPLPLRVPVVCYPLTTKGGKSDACDHINLKNTVADIANSFSQVAMSDITKQLLKNITDIQGLQTNQCLGQSSINLFVLQTWLFRGDLNQSTIDAMLTNSLPVGGASQFGPDDIIAIKKSIEALTVGLGLFPRNIVTSMRIETLAKYLNDPANKEITHDTVQAWEGSPTADTHERSIQAYHSALANLNDTVFATSELTVNEIQNSANQLNVLPVTADFNTYVQYQKAKGPPNSSTICDSQIIPYPVYGVPVGYVNQGNSFTHYAVRVTAKTNKLMFLPVKGGIELEALAAAKPFGSRIGPKDLAGSKFVEKVNPGTYASGGPIDDCSQGAKCLVPNIKLDMNGDSFYTATFLKVLADQSGISAGSNVAISPTTGLGMAPNPIESGHYNILPPPKPDGQMALEFVPYSTGYGIPNSQGRASEGQIHGFNNIYRFYAPIFPSGSGDVSGPVTKALDKIFDKAQVAGNNPFGIDMMTLRSTLQASIEGYIRSHLDSPSTAPGTENGESATFAAIELPMTADPSRLQVMQGPGKPFWISKAEEAMSSWGPDYVRTSAGLKFTPRFGYSVKFVTMQDLKAQGMSTDDPDIDDVKH